MEELGALYYYKLWLRNMHFNVDLTLTPKERRSRELRSERELDAEGLRKWGVFSQKRKAKKNQLHLLLKLMGKLLLILTSWGTGALTSSFPSCPLFLLRLAHGGCGSLRLKREHMMYGI